MSELENSLEWNEKDERMGFIGPEFEITRIKKLIDKNNQAIVFCKTREEALDIQNDILKLEEELEQLEIEAKNNNK